MQSCNRDRDINHLQSSKKTEQQSEKTHLQKHQRIPRTRSFLKIARKTILQSCNPIRCVTSQIICIISIICNHPTNLNNKVKKTHLQKHQRNPRTRSFLKIARKPILQSCNPIRCVTSDRQTDDIRQTDIHTCFSWYQTRDREHNSPSGKNRKFYLIEPKIIK